MAERKFAGTIIKIDGVTIAKITDFSFDRSIGETEVTGAEDVMLGSDILEQKYVATKISSTISFGGITYSSDAGQGDLEDAADQGTSIVIRRTYSDATGYDYTGVITSYKFGGSIGDGIYKFSGSMRVNSKVAVP
jgi:hypothetical protein